MTNEKCQHPACNCVPPEGESFCSVSCKDAGEITELVCQCGHPGCQGEALKY
jgi:hypothetical protein